MPVSLQQRCARGRAFDNITAAEPTDYRAMQQSTGERFVHHALVVLLFACFMAIGGCSDHDDPALLMEGGCPPSSSAFLPADPSVEGRISYCEGGDGWTGTISSALYPPGTQRVELMLTGYPANPGVLLTAVSVEGREVPLTTFNPTERWERAVFDIPHALSREGFRIRLHDQASSAFGWAGMGASITSPASAFMAGALPMLAGVLLGNVWLVALSLALPTCGTARERVQLGLLAAGCIWFTIFCAYVVSVHAGAVTALVALLLPLPLALRARVLHRVSAADVESVQRILLPVMLLSCFVLWIGLFPFHWQGHTGDEPATRWYPLAIDGWLPLLFGDMLANGRLDVPMAADWLSSDRPPLQTGLYLTIRELLPESRGLLYQGISTWAQALVLVPLGSLLTLFGSRRPRAVALFTLCLSALVLLNTLMVWPKLLAAAFCLICYRALFPTTTSPFRWGQAGVAAALALLAHGGALFFLVGASILHLAWYRRHSLTMLLRAGPLAFAIYLPWIFYQRLVDPPGNRLIKWHFAGKIAVSDESALHAITSAYAQLAPSTWLLARIENIEVVIAGAVSGPYQALQVVLGQDPSTISHFVGDSFFHTVHSMWLTSPLLLLPCIALMLWQNPQRLLADPISTQFVQVLAAASFTLLIWVTVLFERGSASIHHGAYAALLLLHLAVLAATWQILPTLFYVTCTANAIVALSAYAFDRPFLPGLQPVYTAGTLLLVCALLAAVFASTKDGHDTFTHAPRT